MTKADALKKLGELKAAEAKDLTGHLSDSYIHGKIDAFDDAIKIIKRIKVERSGEESPRARLMRQALEHIRSGLKDTHRQNPKCGCIYCICGRALEKSSIQNRKS